MNKFFKIPAARTVVRVIEDAYDSARLRFQETIDSIPGRVALTADCWSSRVMKGYFVITVHWIGSDWQMLSAVLDFFYFPAPHNQSTTSNLLLKALYDFRIYTKVRVITTDNGRRWLQQWKSSGTS